ncbi:beta-arrestin-1 [Labeo rohita]|uniref:Beta-arrestin-1 n=1 Tax=Labeo rohita TaxID=84645 RepID=A0A498NQA2_LABRO|nr:beta-arrestin-1 [Labeo rohita]
MRSLMWRIHHRKILHTPSDIEKPGKQQTEQQETVTLHTFDTPSVHCYDEDPSDDDIIFEDFTRQRLIGAKDDKDEDEEGADSPKLNDR